MAGVPQHRYTWEQGSDLEIKLVYNTREDEDADPEPVDLTGYSVRMDIRTAIGGSGVTVFTFNSDDIDDDDVDEPGSGDNEIVLSDEGEITIRVPRALSLPGGEVYEQMAEHNLASFVYDIFLRDPADKQKKILSGTITVNRSATLWI